MPYDVLSIGVIIASATLLFGAASSRFSLPLRLSFILAAAVIIRIDASWQFSLHPWDERYHALVAKNLIAHPLTPTLYRDAPLAFDFTDWMANHIWLHKPPGALWPMAASMAAFGINEFAMRVPGIVLSTLAVWLTFLIGWRLFSTRVGLLASAFQAVNGFLVSLAAGRRVADHVDTALIFWIELGVWLAILHSRRRDWLTLLGAGLALGAGLMTKSLPALLMVPTAFVIFTERDSLRSAAARAATLLIAGAAFWPPWMIYTRLYFPQEAEAAWQYTLLHLLDPVEGHDSSAFSYLLDMPSYFGEIVWIPLLAAVFAVVRGPHARGIVAWLLITYGVFAMAPTRISSYVMIAAPAIFLLEAQFWCWLRDRSALVRGPRLIAIRIGLAVLVLLPARQLLEPSGVFERRDRQPVEAQQLRRLDSVLKLTRGVLFNMPTPIEAMFYSSLIAYPQLPTGDDVRELTERGIPIVIYLTEGTPPIPPDWKVLTVTPAQLR